VKSLAWSIELVCRGCAYCEDDGTNVVIKARSTDGFLVGFRCASFLGQDEASTNPDTGSTEGKGSSKRLTIEKTAGRNDLHIFASEGGLPASAHGGNSWDQDGCGNIASVSTSLATLCANDIDTKIKALLNVLWVANHIHVEDAMAMQLVDDLFRRDADGGDEELSAGLDDDVD
jgi:hypothetical protein